MADLNDLQAAQTVKIAGANTSGGESAFVESTVNGGLHTNLRDAGGLEIGVTGNPLVTNASLESGQLVPTITNQFRIRSNITNITVPVGYVTLFSRSGEGLFFGFQVAFNNADVDIKLTIDGGTVFEINLNTIKQFEFNDTTAGRMQMGGFLTTIGNKLDFSSKFAIPYETSVTLEVKKSSGADKTNNNWIVFLTED